MAPGQKDGHDDGGGHAQNDEQGHHDGEQLADFEAARRWVNPVTTPADMERYLEWRDAAEE